MIVEVDNLFCVGVYVSTKLSYLSKCGKFIIILILLK